MLVADELFQVDASSKVLDWTTSRKFGIIDVNVLPRAPSVRSVVRTGVFELRCLMIVADKLDRS